MANGPWHEESYELVHWINGNFLEFLAGSEDCFLARLFPGAWQSEDWIINVIYATRVDEAADLRVSLRTSSVLHRGDLYNHCQNPNKKVASLDQIIPVEGSVSGYCITAQQPIWLDPDELISVPSSFGGRLYRPFGYVDVAAAKMPSFEIVFPISVRTGLSSIALGALNLEYFPQESKRDAWEIYRKLTVRRENANRIMQLLCASHANFLKIAIGLGHSASSSKRFCRDLKQLDLQSFLSTHRSILDVTGNHILSTPDQE